MRFRSLLLPGCALAAAALLCLSGAGDAYNFLGGSLDLGQRDFRVYNNFSDSSDNDNQVPDFAAKILYLLDNQDVREKMGASGYARVKNEIAWEYSEKHVPTQKFDSYFNDLEHIRLFKGPPNAFWTEYLKSFVSILKAELGMLLIKREESWSKYSVWPTENLGILKKTDIGSKIEKISEKALIEGMSYDSIGKKDHGFLLASTIH